MTPNTQKGGGMLVPFTIRPVSPVVRSRLQALQLVGFLIIASVLRRYSAYDDINDEPWPTPRGVVTCLLPTQPLERLVPQGRPIYSSERRYKLSLTEYGLETLDHIEYVESGVRVSKGCTFSRMRPVFVETVQPRLSSSYDLPSFAAGKVGPIAMVRLGNPPPYAHTFLLLVGAWNVSGRIPGMFSEELLYRDGVPSGLYARNSYATTILNSETVDQRRLAEYEARETFPCRRTP